MLVKWGKDSLFKKWYLNIHVEKNKQDLYLKLVQILTEYRL